jgi:hypothetical protein
MSFRRARTGHREQSVHRPLTNRANHFSFRTGRSPTEDNNAVVSDIVEESRVATMVKASNKAKKSKNQAEDDVDYAAAADSFADAEDSSLLVENDHVDDNENDNRRGSMGGGDDDEEEEEDDHDAGSDGGRSSDEDGDGSDGDSVSEGGESEGSEEGSGSSDESSDGDNLHGDDDENAQDQPVNPSKAVRSASSSHPEACTFDLRNLLAMNTHQVDTVALYKQPPTKNKAPSDEGKTITIPGDSMPAVANDDVLLRMATDGCQQLIAALWQLPVERSDAGPLVTLPGYEEVRIPRALVRWPKEYAPVG